MPELLARHYRSGAPVRLAWDGAALTAAEPAPATRTDLPHVSPALLDIQVNGYGGLDFSGPDHLRRIAATLAAHGVAGFLPTVVTGAEEAMAQALSAVATACDADRTLAAAVPGIHVEGPYISDQDGPRGAHPRQHVRDADWAHFERLQAAAGGRIRLLTLAPERPGALPFIERATAEGIVVAIGHTAADGETIRQAAAAGARLSTHLGNGLAASIDRHHNPLWPQLACPELHASFIADGEHLPSDALAAMIAARGIPRSILVSDSVREAGLPPGRYRGVGGGEVEVRPSGRVALAGTPYLAGSGAHLAHCVGWAAASSAVRLADALEMASLHPARLLGLRGGALAPGAPADLMLYRVDNAQRIEVLATVRGGQVVHGRLPAA